MFLARIDGTLTATVRHRTLQGCRFLIGQRLESDGRTVGEPLIVLDRLGARRGATVVVTTDGDVARAWLGNTTPTRMVVIGLADQVTLRNGSTKGGAR